MENFNIAFKEATDTLNSTKETRVKTVNEMIKELIAQKEQIKEQYEGLSNSKALKLLFNVDNSKELDSYTKRVFKVARCILLDGYRINYNNLTLSQMEQLSKFQKNKVNYIVNKCDKLAEDKSLSKDDIKEIYITEVKELINLAKVEKTTKVFSAKLANEID